MRANDVIYMEEAEGDPSRATHSVNDTDTPGFRLALWRFPCFCRRRRPGEELLAAKYQ